ncbi:MAG: DNA repair protein RadA [Lachnospiraceae bacterium]|nr:DNA repair protein RadA [Lachnospiraceae bacterium]
MAKSKTSIFFCKECGNETSKWSGQCPACKAWNTLVEEPVTKMVKTSSAMGMFREPVKLEEIVLENESRMETGFGELDRVLGGGIVPGSLVLVGGDPGIGKSTLLLQVCRNLAIGQKKVLYISGEESLGQIKMRAERIGKVEGELKFLCETNLGLIDRVIESEKPDVVVIDSIQTMVNEDVTSAAGSVSQVRESTNVLMHIAKGRGIAIFIVGHVTKEGQVAGPRVLEHMVDTVLYFEGERSASYRILRGVKNRFGSTNEIGVFEMLPQGLGEVINPSEYLLSGRPEGASGAAVACLMEGTRSILLEVQALVTETAFGLPRRTAVGTDVNRVNLLMAVIEKRCRIMMNRYDAYINIAGGLRVAEPALDLAIVLALISSVKDRALDDSMVVFGEVGLAGEVRSVAMAEYRVREAEKLGFSRCILPKVCLDKLNYRGKMEIVGVRSIQDAINLL